MNIWKQELLELTSAAGYHKYKNKMHKGYKVSNHEDMPK